MKLGVLTKLSKRSLDQRSKKDQLITNLTGLEAYDVTLFEGEA